MLEFDQGVDVADVNVLRDVQLEGGIVQDGADAALDQAVSNRLSFGGRDGEHGDLDAAWRNFLLDGVDVLDREAGDGFTNLLGIWSSSQSFGSANRSASSSERWKSICGGLWSDGSNV